MIMFFSYLRFFLFHAKFNNQSSYSQINTEHFGSKDYFMQDSLDLLPGGRSVKF